MKSLSSAACLTVAVAAASLGAARAGDVSAKPHIIMHLVDDWGYANAGWHSVNNPEVYTPNMDQLVKDGIELDRACA